MVVCTPDDGRRYHLKHAEQFPDIINCVTLYLVGYILEYNTRSQVYFISVSSWIVSSQSNSANSTSAGR
jgi:hypothetical protein